MVPVYEDKQLTGRTRVVDPSNHDMTSLIGILIFVRFQVLFMSAINDADEFGRWS